MSIAFRKQKDAASSPSSLWVGVAIGATFGFFFAMSLKGATSPDLRASSLAASVQSKVPFAESPVDISPLLKSRGRLLTVEEIKQSMRLPCNFAHDGFYLKESNEVLNQVYETLMALEDHIIPVVIESGGHDGITKTLSLKASACLNMNTLLLEASPTTFNILREARPYDFTVNAALCEEESVRIIENRGNSGQNRVDSIRGNTKAAVTIPCTTIDKEMDKLAELLPESQRSNLKLIFHILDIEGHEAAAVRGIQKYPPSKAIIEWVHLKREDQKTIEDWADGHNLVPMRCGNDRCFNYGSVIGRQPAHLRALLYGARIKPPVVSYKTSRVSPAYMYYGQ